MSLKLCLAAIAASLGLSSSALAQCNDAWVTQAVKAIRSERGMVDQISGSGTTGECDINRYGGGKWNDYNDLLNKVRLSYICDDPWIGQAVAEIERGTYLSYTSMSGQEIRYRVLGGGKIGECNPLTYGSWSSYADLQRLVKENVAGFKYQMGTCRDAWITQVVTEYKKSKGKSGNDAKPFGWAENGECNMYLYAADGQWRNYDHLKQLVFAKLSYLDQRHLQVLTTNAIKSNNREIPPANQLAVSPKGNVLLRPTDATIRNSKLPPKVKDELLAGKTTLSPEAARLIGHDGATLVGNDGASLVGNDGASLIGDGGGTIVAVGGGN